MDWKSAFQKGEELVLVSCSKDAIPHANIVISLGFVDGFLLVADAQMHTTMENLMATRRVCVLSRMPKAYYRIKGSVEITSKGRYFDICSNADKNFPAKHAVLISITEVIDLDSGKSLTDNHDP